MSTYESSSGVGITGSTTFILATKPTGLTEGDVMVAGAYFDVVGVTDIAPPSGWTPITSEQNGDVILKTFIKVADSDDVSASTFSFARSGGASSGFGGVTIVRASNYGIIAGSVDDYNSIPGLSSSATMTGFTPTRANTLFIGFVVLYGASGTYAPTGFSLATDNPTWTQRQALNNSTTRFFYTYTAPRTQATATGTITYTFSTIGATAIQGLASVISISPILNGSTSPDSIEIDAYSFSPIQPAVVDANATEPSTRESNPTQWTNEAKPSTSWTNEQK